MIRVVKIGGNVVDSPRALERFCSDFSSLEGPKVLVHGGGVMLSRLQTGLGMTPVMIEGRRVTDEATLRLAVMAYSGWCNKHITALLQSKGCNAIGLSGCDGGVITASKRAPVSISDGSTVDYGYVGDVVPGSVNAPLLHSLLGLGLVPVLCAINHDGRGNLLNTNADTVASAISCAINAKLLYCFEKNGVLYDKFDEDSVIETINPQIYADLRAQGKVEGGMIPKIDNAFKALRSGAAGVTILSSANLLSEKGTKLVL